MGGVEGGRGRKIIPWNVQRVTLRKQNRDRLRRVVGVGKEWVGCGVDGGGKGGGGRHNLVGRMLGGMKTWGMFVLG